MVWNFVSPRTLRRAARRARKTTIAIATTLLIGFGVIPATPWSIAASLYALTSEDMVTFPSTVKHDEWRPTLTPRNAPSASPATSPSATSPSRPNDKSRPNKRSSQPTPNPQPPGTPPSGNTPPVNTQPLDTTPVEPPPVKPARAEPVTFKVASWNVLGASHTEGRGCNRCHLPDSAQRMIKTVQVIRAHDLHVIGLQEFQPSQQAMFRRQMPNWAVYAAADNAVAWDTTHFTQVATSTVTIPYFGGNPRAMPQVRLRHNTTGREFETISVHTPADVRGPAQRWRDEGVRNLGVRTNSIAATNTPVLLTGDMNDREDFYCQMTGYGMLHASAGGIRTPDTCVPPPRMDVDWILGDNLHVTFTGHLSDDSKTVDYASDHPIIVTTATLR